MKAVYGQLAVVLLSLSAAAAQTGSAPTVLQRIATSSQGADLVVDLAMSAPVRASADVAHNPDRILIDLEGANCAAPFSDLAIRQNGILRVRAAQHSTNPSITRVVVDLDRAHPYALRTEGSHVILTISPVEIRKNASQGAPAAATSGTPLGLLRRQPDRPAGMNGPPPASVNSVPLPPLPVAHTGIEPSAGSVATSAPVPPPPVIRSQPATADGNSSLGASFNPQPASTTPATAAAVASSGFEPGNAKPEPVATAAATEPPPAPEPAPAPPAPEPMPAPAVAIATRSDDPSLHTVFHVKYVADGVAYLDGGSSSGLAEGMRLEIVEAGLPAHQGESIDAADKRVVAELEVSGVAETSAVTDIHSPKRPVKVGDLAYLSAADTAALIQQRALGATRQYPAVVTFTDDDTPDEEARVDVPRPPLPSVNRGRGRIGFDYIGTTSRGVTSVTSTNLGMVFRGDITRIGGTFWNLSGYWRGRLTKQSGSQQTLQNLLNRTYHLNLTYDNPQSNLVAGFGRLYLPWAPSLDTIDGGYFGYRPRRGTTFGVFGGSTPDPSSWSYNPNRAIGGTFINFEGGAYDGFHYTSTSGAAVSMIQWAIDRPFLFFENGISYKRIWSLYDSLQFDSPKGTPATPAPGPGLGRNFLAFRVQPVPRLELTLNHTYFRDIPTYDPALLGTGLLDKFLLQGVSAGARVEVIKHTFISATIGQSFRTGDGHSSVNQMYGLEFTRLPWWKLRADAHYARFSNSYGSGSYTAFTLSRQMTDALRLEILAGQQAFTSPLTTDSRSRFLTGTIETNFGPHYFLQGNATTARGQLSYDQWMMTVGYRFDTKGHKQE
jgi:hypothetical protein